MPDEVARIVKTPDGKFFINLSQALLPFHIDCTLLDYRLKVQTENENPNPLRLFNKRFEEYSLTTPLFYVIEDDFYLKMGNEIYFILIKSNYFLDPPNAKNDQENWGIWEFSDKKPGDAFEKETKVAFQSLLAQRILKAEQKFVSLGFLRNCVKDVINQISIEKKQELDLLQFKIDFVTKRLERMKNLNTENHEVIEKKARRRVNIYLSFILAQVCLVQYGTYYVFSWDIMEPLTCLLGVIDLIIPFYFWLKNEKDYDFESLKKSIVEKKSKRRFRKKDYKEEIETLEEILKGLNGRKVFYLESLEKIVGLFESEYN